MVWRQSGILEQCIKACSENPSESWRENSIDNIKVTCLEVSRIDKEIIELLKIPAPEFESWEESKVLLAFIILLRSRVVWSLTSSVESEIQFQRIVFQFLLEVILRKLLCKSLVVKILISFSIKPVCKPSLPKTRYSIMPDLPEKNVTIFF